MQPPEAPCALVVDDDFLVRMSSIEILEEAGFRVLQADHGDAAHELLEHRHPEISLLFTDVQMPGILDGFALARRVAVSWPHISIVVVSGHARPEPGSMPDKAYFLSKPFSTELVHAYLKTLLHGGQEPERPGDAADLISN